MHVRRAIFCLALSSLSLRHARTVRSAKDECHRARLDAFHQCMLYVRSIFESPTTPQTGGYRHPRLIKPGRADIDCERRTWFSALALYHRLPYFRLCTADGRGGGALSTRLLVNQNSLAGGTTGLRATNCCIPATHFFPSALISALVRSCFL